MGASISHKLKNSLEGALAGGGDPATSPLYVFGPFLSLIVGAGVASVTFGASIWLAVFTVVVVSAMYRYVMIWITDGSGGSGLSEEEFGSWAVKINAAITVIEYTLTFLVSIAALVTFLADRFPTLNSSFAGIGFREIIAIALSILVVQTVNRGPRISTKFFGPATALILIFLWVMVISVIWQRGFHLPDFNLAAFDGDHIHYTLGGFARILALMTGIEIFANLVAAFQGTALQRSQRAFGSLMIVMGTTAITMIIVGPAIHELADPSLLTKSVFTQTMDALLPPWLSYTGTLIGVAVLLSAAAASAQGMQNLFLGLRARHYIPAKWGKRNKSDVPSIPTWIQGSVVVVSFLFIGTREETYLALYAAGVFVLLSMTGWSAVKRFCRYFGQKRNFENGFGISITIFSALCASFAAIIIFEERFMEGAWSYLIMVPGLYFIFNFYRERLGPPSEVGHHLHEVINASPLPLELEQNQAEHKISKILVPLSGEALPEFAFHLATKIAAKMDASIYPLHISDSKNKKDNDMEKYLENFNSKQDKDSNNIYPILKNGDVAKDLIKIATEGGYELICMASGKMRSNDKIIHSPLAYKFIYATTPPVLILRPSDRWESRMTDFKNILVPLDGSETAEQVLPHAMFWAKTYGSSVTLLSIPEDQGNVEFQKNLLLYLEKIGKKFLDLGIPTTYSVEGSGPSRTILEFIKDGSFDLITMASHGKGGLNRQAYVKLGSVSEAILSESDTPILFISGEKNKKGQCISH